MRANSFTLLAAAGLGLSFVNGAVAADMPLKARPKIPVVAPLYSWTGFYVGANFGGAWSNSSFTNANTGLDWTPGSTGFIGGLQGGYNYQIGNLVLGVEADIDWASFDRSTQFAIPPAGVVRASADTNWISTVAARVGLWMGPLACICQDRRRLGAQQRFSEFPQRHQLERVEHKLRVAVGWRHRIRICRQLDRQA